MDDEGTVFKKGFLAIMKADESGDGRSIEAQVEAEVAGPYEVRQVDEHRWAAVAEGDEPEVVGTYEIATMAAAVLPAIGRPPLVSMRSEAAPEGYALVTEQGEVLGYSRHHQPALAPGLHLFEHVRRHPPALARLMWLSFGAALERAGRILRLWALAGKPRARVEE